MCLPWASGPVLGESVRYSLERVAERVGPPWCASAGVGRPAGGPRGSHSVALGCDGGGDDADHEGDGGADVVRAEAQLVVASWVVVVAAFGMGWSVEEGSQAWHLELDGKGSEEQLLLLAQERQKYRCW